MNNIRKVIPGFPLYECDATGNIFTIEHTTMRYPKPTKGLEVREKTQARYGKAMQKKITMNKRSGYCFVCAVDENGKRQTLYQHRAVWSAFNERMIPKGFEIDHLNNCRSDNRLENLELVTRSENCKRMRERQRLNKKEV